MSQPNRSENKEKNGGARNYHLRRRYGITAEHFDAMFAEQFRDREDLMLRAVLYLGRNVGDSLDYPDLHAGLHVGGYDNIRPEGEPRVA